MTKKPKTWADTQCGVRDGWYIASLGGASWEVVRVKGLIADMHGMSAGDLVAESAGYQTPFPIEKFIFAKRIKMPRHEPLRINL